MKRAVVLFSLFLTVACDRDVIGVEPAMDGGASTLDAGVEPGPDACVPSPEICDGLDNDCNGVVDNAVTDDERQCQVGLGPCEAMGEMRCIGGELVCNALAIDPSTEVCDGVDNDCDGVVDNPMGEICCGGDEDTAPCNGCPDGTAVPDGWSCIPAGAFSMGSPEGTPGATRDAPQHPVQISRPFLLMTTEVTQAQWRAVFDNDPSLNRGRDAPCDACPVARVNWFEAVAYVNALSSAAGLPECYVLESCEGEPGDAYECAGATQDGWAACVGYRLPTEAEWEYATRAGTDTRYWSGEAEAALDGVGWYADNSAVEGAQQTHPVAEKNANAWGLYDVHGNVSEWVHGGYEDYAGVERVDPHGASDLSSRVLRGGSAFHGANVARSAHRTDHPPVTLGFHFGIRVARSLP